VTTTPRYKAIEAFLLERIQGGAFPVNHQIPPEEQLARDFGVSRMTANKAIQNLVQQGYLMRQAGLGTFVHRPQGRIAAARGDEHRQRSARSRPRLRQPRTALRSHCRRR
jgi:DNA-binding GntR family transcriptional regulator